MVIFFFASPAASSAYLTVSETFPLEVRALAIALFYAIGTGIGGVAGPALFGALIDTGSRNSVFAGYLLGAGLMLAAAGDRVALLASRPNAGRWNRWRGRSPLWSKIMMKSGHLADQIARRGCAASRDAVPVPAP